MNQCHSRNRREILNRYDIILISKLKLSLSRSDAHSSLNLVVDNSRQEIVLIWRELQQNTTTLEDLVVDLENPIVFDVDGLGFVVGGEYVGGGNWTGRVWEEICVFEFFPTDDTVVVVGVEGDGVDSELTSVTTTQLPNIWWIHNILNLKSILTSLPWCIQCLRNRIDQN